MSKREKKEWPLEHDLTTLMKAHQMFPRLRKIEQELTRMELKFGEDFFNSEDGTVSMLSLRNWMIRAEGARMAFNIILEIMSLESHPSYSELKAICGLGAKNRNNADRLIREDYDTLHIVKEPKGKKVQYQAHFCKKVTRYEDEE